MTTSAELLSRQLIIVAGKGGVGKTSFAAALSVCAAQKGHRVLMAQMKAPAGLGRMIGSREPEPHARPTDTVPGMWTVNLDPRRAVEQFGSLRLKRASIMRTLLSNRAVRFFIEAIPGLEILAMLGRVWYYTIEEENGDPVRFRTVILESPGLGHLVRLLRLPETVLDSVPDGPLRNDAHQIASLLRDPDRCSIVAVTLAEELPIRETLELERSLETVGHGFAQVVVNSLYPGFLTQNPLLNKMLDLDPAKVHDPSLQTMVHQSRLFRTRRMVNETWLNELRRHSRAPQLWLPRYFVPALTLNEIQAMAARIANPDAVIVEPPSA